MAETGIPAGGRRRRLGQNFLADPNLLDAIVREAAPAHDDVVLEVGGGEGALTTRLATQAGRVHVIEIDERLRGVLERLAAENSAVRLHWADAVRFDLGTLDPQPTAMVSNLPYAVATPVIMRVITDLPTVTTITVMVQREIAERLRAPVNAKDYGAPSAIAQLACEVAIVRKVGREVFVPRPRVDSAVLRLTRRGPAPDEWTVAVIRAGFAHRRKALARSLELALPAAGPRARIVAALESLGVDPRVRAQELMPDELASLAGELSAAEGRRG